MSKSDHSITPDDVAQLKQFREKQRMHNGRVGLTPEERGRINALERKPRLPSDLACDTCGGCIEHDERCFGIHDGEVIDGRNEYGEFSETADTVLCSDCS